MNPTMIEYYDDFTGEWLTLEVPDYDVIAMLNAQEGKE